MFKNILWITLFFVSPVWSFSAKKLDESSKAVSEAAIANVQLQQLKVSNRLKIQERINILRARQGASNDQKIRKDLEMQIKKLQMQISKK